jgi:hypothetical protein
VSDVQWSVITKLQGNNHAKTCGKYSWCTFHIAKYLGSYRLRQRGCHGLLWITACAYASTTMNEQVHTEYGKQMLTFACTLWIPTDGDSRPTLRFVLRLGYLWHFTRIIWAQYFMNKKSGLSKMKLYNPLQINESHLSTVARSTKYLTNCCYNFCQKNNSSKVIVQLKLLLYHFYDDSRWWNFGIYSRP